MPSHPDRVRRNYHEIRIGEFPDIQNFADTIYIHVSKHEIASAMSAKEIYYNVVRAVKNSIFERWTPSKFPPNREIREGDFPNRKK